MRRSRARAAMAAAVLTAGLGVMGPASAHDGLFTSAISSDEAFGGYAIRYNGLATHAVTPPTNALHPASAVHFACEFVNVGSTRPYQIVPECSVEDLDSGAVYKDNLLYSAGGEDAGASGAYALAHQRLLFCIRAVVHPARGVPPVTGPRMCGRLAP